MSLSRIALASLGAFVTYFILGGLAFGLFPSLRNEFLKYPAVYRNQDSMKSHMPAGMLAMFVSIVALSVIYAMLYQGNSTFGEGLRLGAMYGALIGIFFVGAFVVHNYVNLNIGLTLTLQQAVAYFIEWTVTGIVIGIIYRPVLPR
ncbi:MAG: hypothetical protein WCC95_12340 [Candidatus Sulfotelmatobacter sp.]|jgi:hypothetical protein